MLDLFQKVLLKITKGKTDSMSIRDIRLALSILTAGLDKFIGIGSTLITMPITLNYLGPIQFGIWMVISGFVTFLSFSDLGIGMGLQNALSRACGESDKESPKHLISSAYFIVFCAIILMSVLVLLLGNVVSIANIFSLDSGQDLNIAAQTLSYCLIIFFIGIPISLIQRILNGYQKTYIANNILLVGKIISLISIFVSVWLDLGLVGLAVLFMVSPLLSMLCYSLYFFSTNSELFPRINRISKEHIKKIMSSGFWTVFVQLIYTAKMNIPVIIVSTSIGMVAVAEYSIAQKLIGVGALIINMALQPLWTVYGEAYYKRDRVWIEKTLFKSIRIVLMLTGFCSGIFMLFGQKLIEFWLGDSVLPSLSLIFCFSLWMIASSVNICFAMLLNGTGNFKNQSLFSVILVSTALIIAYSSVSSFGMTSVIFSIFLIAELLRIPLFYMETKKVISTI
ncbi:lipopolysaccharide biosynthesis protein [Vibrio breoganii]